jgi:hypothetical protein
LTGTETVTPPGNNNQRYIELAIPVTSFGATIAGMLLWQMGIDIGFQYFAIGCLIGSCLLAYLAWTRPKKDIVSLSTPLYAFIFFVVPTDYAAGVTLQIFYAASLTLLLVRLKYRFGAAHTAATLGKDLAPALKAYVKRTRDAVSVSPEEAHRATLAITQFSLGEYGKAARASGTSGGESSRVITRAFGIVTEHAALLDTSHPRPFAYLEFSPEDAGLLAIPVLPEYSDDRKFDTALDNALLLLFSAAWNGAEAERPDLLACQALVLKLLE